MLIHHVLLRMQHLGDQQIQRKQRAGNDAQRAKSAKEVQRPAHVVEQEANRQQIKENTEGPAYAVVALTPLTVHILDRNLADRGAVPRSQRRNKPVHLAIERNVVDDLAAIRLEGSAEV